MKLFFIIIFYPFRQLFLGKQAIDLFIKILLA